LAQKRPCDAGPASREHDPFVVAAEFVSHWWPSLLQGVGGVLLVVAGLTDSKHRVIVLPGHLPQSIPFWAGFACVLIGGVVAAIRQPDRAALARRIVTLERQVQSGNEALRSLRRSELSLLARQLGYFSTERISLFAHDRDGFVLVARHSANPRFEAPGRTRYPLGEGCLGKAWDDGSAAVVDLPDPAQDPTDWQRALLDRWNMPLETSAALVMKARTCIAIRIDTAGARAPIGVVVFESQLTCSDPPARTPGAPGKRGGPVLDPSELNKIMKGTDGVRLLCMVEFAAEVRH